MNKPPSRREFPVQAGQAGAAALEQLRVGYAHETAGLLQDAAAAYRAAALAQPSLEEAQYRAGNLLEFLGGREKALAHFQRGARARSALGKICAGRAALLQSQDAEAVRHFRQALARDRGNATAADWLGSVLADAGDFAGAFEAYAMAVREPALAGSFYDLVRCRKLGPADAWVVDAIDAALANPALPAPMRLRVHLARGKAADDAGDPALAMLHFGAAAELRAALAPFDPAAFDALIDRLIAWFPAERFASAPLGAQPGVPVLVIGLPRSGTTLVEHILGTHPAIAAGGELAFWNERGAQYRPGPSQADFISRAGADYLAQLRQIGPGAAHVTDKMPFNFLWAGLALLAMPNARIVHCRRHPADTALSIHRTHFHPHLRFPTGGAGLVAYVRAYARLMAHWRRALPANRFVEMQYEALVTSPRTEVPRLLQACGLPWHEPCLHPETNTVPVRTPSKWQVRAPIHAGAVGGWRRYEPFLGPLEPLVGEDG